MLNASIMKGNILKDSMIEMKLNCSGITRIYNSRCDVIMPLRCNHLDQNEGEFSFYELQKKKLQQVFFFKKERKNKLSCFNKIKKSASETSKNSISTN